MLLDAYSGKPAECTSWRVSGSLVVRCALTRCGMCNPRFRRSPLRCSAAVFGTVLCMTCLAAWNTATPRERISASAAAEEGGAAAGVPFHLRCEYLQNPLGIDKSSPQLSWQIGGQDRDWQQAAYQVFVATSESLLRDGKADVWDSGRVPSGQSVGIFYGGPQLQSERRYFWKVRVWDSHGQASDSSESAWWEMGLLAPNDWKARWISW